MNTKLIEGYLGYSDEQLERIILLKEVKKTRSVLTDNWYKDNWYKEIQLKEHDHVQVTLKAISFPGVIIKINKDNTYDINSVHGIIKNIKKQELSKRMVKDLSKVEIPVELKKISTGELLSLLRNTYSAYECDYEKKYSSDVLKAELKNRPHLTNKRERKVINNLKKNKNA